MPIDWTIKPAELLTVMIKRKKGYNRKVGDWEFLTCNGTGTETTSRGKLENCQSCHIENKSSDYVSRTDCLMDMEKESIFYDATPEKPFEGEVKNRLRNLSFS